MEQDRDAPSKGTPGDAGGPAASDRTIFDLPPPVDPDLVERTHRLEQEIAEDERALQQETQQQ